MCSCKAVGSEAVRGANVLRDFIETPGHVGAYVHNPRDDFARFPEVRWVNPLTL